MSVDYNEIKKTLTDYANAFLQTTNRVLSEGFDFDIHNKQEDAPGFPILGQDDEFFYKSKYQEGLLEYIIRNSIVNKSFDYLFNVHGDYDIRWRQSNKNTGTVFRNSESEQKNPVEFFLVRGSECLAVRYTPAQVDYSISLNLPSSFDLSYHRTGIKSKDITKWICIDWNKNPKNPGNYHHNFNTPSPDSNKVDTITLSLKDFFLHFLSEEEYCIFTDVARAAVEKAYQSLKYRTIHIINNSNISVYKNEILSDLINADYLNATYQFIDRDGNALPKKSNYLFNDIDAEIIDSQFRDHSRYLALVGSKDFAKSFITSEYLYKTLEPELALDYTPVVCGYFKAVEQLCSTIVYDILPLDDDNIYYIKASRGLKDYEKAELIEKNQYRNKDGKDWVALKLNNSEYYNKKMELGPLVSFLKDYKESIFAIEKTDELFKCLDNFRAFDRNGYLHKDNICIKSIATRIRDNTKLILYWLLGATKLNSDQAVNTNHLGIIDDRFSRLYAKIAFRSEYRFIIIYGNLEKKAIRIPSSKQIVYDSNGSITGVSLFFMGVDSFPANHTEYYRMITERPDDKIIEVSSSNIPDAIYSIDYQGQKHPVTI